MRRWITLGTMFVLLLALCAAAPAPTSVSQPPGHTSMKNASLIEAEASFSEGNLVITLKTEEEPMAPYRIYIDADANGSTGFRHPAREKNGGEGADFIIENGALAQWAGAKDQRVSKWSPLPGFESLRTETLGNHQLSIFIQTTPLRVKEGDKIRVWVETVAPGGGKSEDMIPRDGPWEFQVPPGALKTAALSSADMARNQKF